VTLGGIAASEPSVTFGHSHSVSLIACSAQLSSCHSLVSTQLDSSRLIPINQLKFGQLRCDSFLSNVAKPHVQLLLTMIESYIENSSKKEKGQHLDDQWNIKWVNAIANLCRLWHFANAQLLRDK
jgi:hypothetical protein